MLTTKKKQTIIKKTRQHERDSGSAEVQTALLSEQIEQLTKHLKKHKQDEHSRRGLLKLVAKRRKHMKYIEKKQKKLSAKTTK
ncbi:MAG: 30S ribosomal protein S15 [Patescibacteria group bacterium]